MGIAVAGGSIFGCATQEQGGSLCSRSDSRVWTCKPFTCNQSKQHSSGLL